MIGAVFWWIRYYRRRRRADLAALADRIGFRFLDGRAPGWREAMGSLSLPLLVADRGLSVNMPETEALLADLQAMVEVLKSRG